jgi:dTDP-4-dehydrorhamnose reductase
MKIVVTGAPGLLGSDLCRILGEKFSVQGLGRSDNLKSPYPYTRCDLADTKAAEQVIHSLEPDILFHAAAMTEVDSCESKRSEAYRDNVLLTENMVRAAKTAGALLVFFSTDYIFNGEKAEAYTESDIPQPLNYYGETKYLAEKYIVTHAARYVIFRISWLYGLGGRCFPEAILERAKERQQISVVDDQWGRPTYSADIADCMLSLSEQKKWQPLENQIWHIGNQGYTNWADYAETLLRSAQYRNVAVNRIDSKTLNRPAKRPQKNILDLNKFVQQTGIEFRHWNDALNDYLFHLMKIKKDLFYDSAGRSAQK